MELEKKRLNSDDEEMDEDKVEKKKRRKSNIPKPVDLRSHVERKIADIRDFQIKAILEIIFPEIVDTGPFRRLIYYAMEKFYEINIEKEFLKLIYSISRSADLISEYSDKIFLEKDQHWNAYDIETRRILTIMNNIIGKFDDSLLNLSMKASDKLTEEREKCKKKKFKKTQSFKEEDKFAYQYYNLSDTFSITNTIYEDIMNPKLDHLRKLNNISDKVVD
jgi:hypothetical protein